MLMAWTSAVRCLKAVPLTSSSTSRYLRMPSRVMSCPFWRVFANFERFLQAKTRCHSVRFSYSPLSFFQAFHGGDVEDDVLFVVLSGFGFCVLPEAADEDDFVEHGV
jgi:hypothetical protein